MTTQVIGCSWKKWKTLLRICGSSQVGRDDKSENGEVRKFSKSLCFFFTFGCVLQLIWKKITCSFTNLCLYFKIYANILQSYAEYFKMAQRFESFFRSIKYCTELRLLVTSLDLRPLRWLESNRGNVPWIEPIWTETHASTGGRIRGREKKSHWSSQRSLGVSEKTQRYTRSWWR